MMSDGKDKACPFCGSKEWEYRLAGIGGMHVHCEQCGADGPAAYIQYNGMDWNRHDEADRMRRLQAHELWNKREKLPQPFRYCHRCSDSPVPEKEITIRTIHTACGNQLHRKAWEG